MNVEFKAEIYNLLNHANFANPNGLLPASLGTASNQLRPSQPYSASTAGVGSWGTFQSTVGRTIGLGTNRQIQMSLRFSF